MKTQHKHLLQRTYLVLVFGFMYLPIAVLIAYSFNENKSRAVFTGFSLKWYASLFHNEMILSALGLSLVLAFVSAIIATVLGTLATIGINSMSRKAQLIINNISYVPVINPEIIKTSGEQDGAEGCLSFPGEFGMVKRPMNVTVRAQDRNGKTFEISGTELLARAFCHEIDHLNGVCFVTRASRMLEPDELES